MYMVHGYIQEASLVVQWYSIHLPSRRCGFHPSLGREMLWRRKWQSTPLFLLGKSHGQRSYSPWGCKRVGHVLATKQQTAIYPNTATLFWDLIIGRN